MYAIAEFVNTNSAAVIPTNWFYDKKEKKYLWPEKSWNISKRNKAVEERWTPHLNRKTFEIRVIEKAGNFVYI